MNARLPQRPRAKHGTGTAAAAQPDGGYSSGPDCAIFACKLIGIERVRSLIEARIDLDGAAMDRRPRLFIGSSAESRDIAHVVSDLLNGPDVRASVWDDDIFALSKTAFDSLVSATRSFDFALLIATGDDITVSRGRSTPSPRDNIIFEIGLFMGALGVTNTFFLLGAKKVPKLPSDLLGVVSAQFDEEDFLARPKRTLRGPCERIRNQILQTFQYELGVCSKRIAAVCVSEHHSQQVLLVRTTAGRWSFPKGRLLTDEMPQNAALRLARFKAGLRDCAVMHRISDYQDRGGRSYSTISAFLLDAGASHVTPAEKFRAPTWFNESDAIARLSLGRNPDSINTLKEVLREALG